MIPSVVSQRPDRTAGQELNGAVIPLITPERPVGTATGREFIGAMEALEPGASTRPTLFVQVLLLLLLDPVEFFRRPRVQAGGIRKGDGLDGFLEEGGQHLFVSGLREEAAELGEYG